MVDMHYVYSENEVITYSENETVAAAVTATIRFQCHLTMRALWGSINDGKKKKDTHRFLSHHPSPLSFCIQWIWAPHIESNTLISIIAFAIFLDYVVDAFCIDEKGTNGKKGEGRGARIKRKHPSAAAAAPTNNNSS